MHKHKSLPLSPRLLAVLIQIPLHTNLLIDVGCDHGYLGIGALLYRKVQQVWAVDINPQPLKSAKTNCTQFGVLDQTKFFVSDGFNQLPSLIGPATLVCAGMGSKVIVQIINQCDPKVERIILLTHTLAYPLRVWAHQNGWVSEYETIVADHGHYYELVVLVKTFDLTQLKPVGLAQLLLGNPSSTQPNLAHYCAYWNTHLKRLRKIPSAKRLDFHHHQIAVIEHFLTTYCYETQWTD